MCVINDPLGQTHSPSSSDHYSHLKVVLFCENFKSDDTTCKIVITTGFDRGLASWINLSPLPLNNFTKQGVYSDYYCVYSTCVINTFFMKEKTLLNSLW